MAKEINLANGRGVVIVSDEDFDRVSVHPWRVKLCGIGAGGKPLCHAQTNLYVLGKKVAVTLHRFVLGAEEGEKVDHENGDGLDCRRENLRLWTNYGYNARHRSKKERQGLGYFGVRKRPSGRFEARVYDGKRCISAGTYDDIDDALIARDELEIRVRGKDAMLNFPRRPS